ncbi:MAG: FIST C-terminal domain-containing protein [Acidimicrobiia bacterium]|nr:FIST C-terminal domain-containing protein [Acidimicrobiia bacterium]
MSFAVACSETDSTAAAAAAVADDLGGSFGGESPALVVFFATAAHLGAMDTLAAVLAERLAPAILLGASAVSVIAGSRELEEVPAVVAWGAGAAEAAPVRFGPALGSDHSPIEDLPAGDDRPRTLLLLSDPFSFPADRLLQEIDATGAEVRAVGGLASAASSPGGNRLVLDGETFDDGAVGLLLASAAEVATVVSQGCRPIGRPYVVTRGERNLIHELGGRPALERLQEIVGGLSDAERALVQRGLHIGIVVNEHKLDFDRGDFLVRGVLGIERESRGLAVGDLVETGTSVQFHVRDAATAGEDLHRSMSGRRAEGALLFTCNGRGHRLFGVADHDASVVSGAIAPAPVAGMFCAGEIGPVGRRSYLHGFTASVALFGQGARQ